MLIRYDKIGDGKSEVRFKIEGHNFASKRWCGGNNNNFLEIYKLKSVDRLQQYCGDKRSDFDFLSNPIPENEWILAFRTEHINQNKCVVWNEIVINKSKLCNNVDDAPLLLKVMDYKTNDGNHKLVGGLMRTYEELRKDFAAKKSLGITKKDRENRGSLLFKEYSEGSIYY